MTLKSLCSQSIFVLIWFWSSKNICNLMKILRNFCYFYFFSKHVTLWDFALQKRYFLLSFTAAIHANFLKRLINVQRQGYLRNFRKFWLYFVIAVEDREAFDFGKQQFFQFRIDFFSKSIRYQCETLFLQKWFFFGVEQIICFQDTSYGFDCDLPKFVPAMNSKTFVDVSNIRESSVQTYPIF